MAPEIAPDVKFSLVLGANALEFEGASHIFDQKVSPIIERLLDRAEHEPVLLATKSSSNPDAVSSKPSGGAVPLMTTKSVATKLNANGGTALLYAVIASLSIVKAKDTFNRQDITSEMKSATGFYKPSYSSNLSNYLDTLLKQGVIIEVAKDTFALKESERPTMEQKLA